MDRLNVSTAGEYSDEELQPFGGAANVVRANPAKLRRMVLVGRLQRALGFEGNAVDGEYGVNTNRVLEAHVELKDGATFDDRLWALGQLELGSELETIVIQWWKEHDRGPK